METTGRITTYPSREVFGEDGDRGRENDEEGTSGTVGVAGGTRRIACDVCRDRKVRCDKAQPQCGRCQRLGHYCSYMTFRRMSTLDVPQAILKLHSRLGKHETCPNALSPQKILIPFQAQAEAQLAISRSSSTSADLLDLNQYPNTWSDGGLDPSVLSMYTERDDGQANIASTMATNYFQVGSNEIEDTTMQQAIDDWYVGYHER